MPILYTSMCNVSPTTPHAAMLRGLDLIILNEASMIPAHSLCATDLLLLDLMNNHHPFGGKVIVLRGDFWQVLPVVRHPTQAAIAEGTLKHSPLWPVLTTFYLVENMGARKMRRSLQNGHSNLVMECCGLKYRVHVTLLSPSQRTALLKRCSSQKYSMQ